MWDQDWGLPRVKRGTVGCNPTSLAAGGGIGYIVKRVKRAQRRESWGRAVTRILGYLQSPFFRIINAARNVDIVGLLVGNALLYLYKEERRDHSLSVARKGEIILLERHRIKGAKNF